MKFNKCKEAFWILVVIAILLQLVQVERTNPPVTGEIEAPEQVMVILRRSCYDCHSNETAWPWYSYVAPMSWLVTDDVHEGRRHMNFSHWADYNTKQKNHKTKLIGKLVQEGEMPLWFYLPLHPDAQLLPEDVEILVAWSKSQQ